MSWATQTPNSNDSWKTFAPHSRSIWEDAGSFTWDGLSTDTSLDLLDLTWDGISWKILSEWSLDNVGSAPSWIAQNMTSDTYTTSLQPHTTWEI
tara:strand:- start:15056 stop:15337 length:282 start_codon:yes stop_codon:yes gene_type:complete